MLVRKLTSEGTQAKASVHKLHTPSLKVYNTVDLESTRRPVYFCHLWTRLSQYHTYHYSFLSSCGCVGRVHVLK